MRHAWWVCDATSPASTLHVADARRLEPGDRWLWPDVLTFELCRHLQHILPSPRMTALRRFLCGDQDLKKKYNASWGLVTGGSSGIGFSIAQKLAHQGVNVVIAAVDDSILHSSVERLQKDFPDVEVRSVGVDLARDGYMDTIKKATDDVDVQLVFVNAGFVRTGLFAASPVGVPMANFNVNATHAIQVSHHFIVRMRETGLRGCVCFTSSPACECALPWPVLVLLVSARVQIRPEAHVAPSRCVHTSLSFPPRDMRVFSRSFCLMVVIIMMTCAQS